MWHWPTSFFATYLDVLVEREHLSASDAKAIRQALDTHESNPNAFLMTPPVLAIIAAKR